MPKNNTPVAKISRPKITGAFLRERLFHLLDECSSKPLTWLCAPAGAGKATLAASYVESRNLPCLWYQVDKGDADISTFFHYMGLAAKQLSPKNLKPLPLLTPEYALGVPVFTRRYFESLFSSLPQGAIVVLDNFQDAGSTTFDEMISIGMDAIPEGSRVLIVSRDDPSSAFSRFRTHKKLHIIGWDKIRFTLEESRAIICQHEGMKIEEEALRLLYTKTDGWVAGLLLMAEQLGQGKVEMGPFPGGQQALFDYFASEVFSRADEETRGFLLRSVFLPSMTAAMAESLTGISGSHQILSRLSRQHFFIDWNAGAEPVFQFHPLFREFLLSRARQEIEPVALFSCMKKAAAILAGSGQIEGAAALMREAGDWEGLSALVMKQAQPLIECGRCRPLEEWIAAIPGPFLEKTPWLLFWRGACQMACNPGQARVFFEKAYNLFKLTEDAAGLFLAWASIVDTYAFEWGDFRPLDSWVTEFDSLCQRYPAFPAPEVEVRAISGIFVALMCRQPQHTDLPRLAERLGNLILDSDNLSLLLALGNNLAVYYLCMGDFAKSALVLDSMRRASKSKELAPLSLQWWFAAEAMYTWIAAEHEACLAVIARSIALGEETGARLLDYPIISQGIYSGISQGDIASAEELLKRIARINSPRIMDKSLYYYMAALVAWKKGDFVYAFECAQRSIHLIEQCGCPVTETIVRMCYGVILLDLGRYAEAAAELAKALNFAAGLTHLEFSIRLCTAWLALRQGGETAYLEGLRKALAIGARQGYANFSLWQPEMMSCLCSTALEQGIEPDYVIDLIKKRRLTPPRAYPYLNNWPYPVMIYTRGRFSIVLDGKPHAFSGKMQKKPVEMLKVLIKSGGRGVAEEVISDALWPDAEGDMAHQSFKFTLHKLRKLLGNDMTIRVEGGQVNLDRRYCWVDAWAEK